MKLTSTTTSTSLYDLIEAQHPEVLKLIEAKVIKGWSFGNYWVEFCYNWSEIEFETIYDTAIAGEWRKITETLPTLAFNVTDLRNVKVIGAGSFIITIV